MTQAVLNESLMNGRSAAMIHPAALLAESGRWYVLHTKARQEKALAGTLHAMSVPYFLPVMRSQRFHGRQVRMTVAPLFPNYLFVRGDMDQVYAADRTKRVACIIPVNDQAKLDGELRQLYRAIACKAPLDPHPFLKKGIRVEVTRGPFQGMQGLIEDRTRDHRLILQVDVLGQATSLEIDGSLLEPVV